jgi:hypothetical protein
VKAHVGLHDGGLSGRRALKTLLDSGRGFCHADRTQTLEVNSRPEIPLRDKAALLRRR